MTNIPAETATDRDNAEARSGFFAPHGDRIFYREKTMTTDQRLAKARLAILQVLAAAIAQHNESLQGKHMYKIEKPTTVKRFRPIQIVDLDLERSRLVPGSKTIFNFYFLLSEPASADWQKYFNEAYFDKKTRRIWRDFARCDGQHLHIQDDDTNPAKIKNTLAKYVSAINDKCLDIQEQARKAQAAEENRKRQVKRDKQNRERLEQEALSSIRDRIFKRKPKP